MQDASKQGCLGKLCKRKRREDHDDNEMEPRSKFSALKKLNCFKKLKREVGFVFPKIL